MTEIMPTVAEITAARVGARLHEQLAAPFVAGPSPKPPLVPHDTIVEARVAASLAPTYDRVPAPLAAAKSTGALIAARAAEDRSELDRFVEMIAEHFECAGLVSDEVRMRVKVPFQELRRLARQLTGEAERRAADPTAPGRDAHGKGSLADAL